ncbi:MAG: PepSY-associated TM helix domain-containing protein [Bacteroidales bacterium]
MARFDVIEEKWKMVEIPVHDQRVVDLMKKMTRFLFLTRSHLLGSPDHPKNLSFKKFILPPPENYNNNEGLFKTLWVIHSGEIAGFAGKLFVDFIGIVFVFLTFTGLTYWLFPKWIKNRKRKEKPVQSIVRVNRFSLKWHNKIGVWMVVFLLITAITGMFLRPPLLIAIANAQVGKIPFTILDSPNPRDDKLRRIFYDNEKDRFVIGTNKRIYFADPDLKSELKYAYPQPPISVMGINVFENLGKGNYLVGSFNGMFMWNRERTYLVDIYNPKGKVQFNPGGPPLSANMTAGFIDFGNHQFVFDYNRGVEALQPAKQFPEMPHHVLEQSPMSLWNLALEFHTGRYYSFIFGRLYILFIPFLGLTMLLILITGFWLWLKIYRK